MEINGARGAKYRKKECENDVYQSISQIMKKNKNRMENKWNWLPSSAYFIAAVN